MNESFGQNHADNQPAAGTHGPQNANIAAAFCNDCAEGIEDNEGSHKQRQRAKHAKSHLSGLERCKHLLAAQQRAKVIVFSEGGTDILGDLLAADGVVAGEGDVDDVDTPRLAGQRLGFGQGHNHFFGGWAQVGQQDADHGQTRQPVDGGQGEGIAHFDGNIVGE